MPPDYTKDYIELKTWLDSTRDTPLEAMDSFFENRLNDYEEHMSRWIEHYKWLASLLPDSIENLLDLGCGTGLELDRIFERFPKLRVTGVDLSAGMLAKLGEKHKNHNLTLICEDYFKYDFPQNTYDAAVSVESLHHFTASQKEGLYKKIRESLTPGGVYLECDYIAVTQEIENLTFAECRRRRIRDRIPDDKYIHFDTPLTLENELKAMKTAGFTSVEVVGFLPHDNHTPIIRAVK